MHENYLKQALSLAETRQGFCAPNPSVGAVVVKDNQILSTGIHFRHGAPHAEVDALNQLGDEANGATIYVTLEPCCHWGKTPPCTQLLIERGIKEVIYSFVDPNPLIAGKGQQILSTAGIKCTHVPLVEINEFYSSYTHWHHTQLPFVTAKLAISMDSKIAGPLSQPISISGPQLQVMTHQWRKKSDAILTTSKTILQDNPQLNVRIDGAIYQKPLYILDSQLNTPIGAAIFHSAESITIFHQPNTSRQKMQNLIHHGAHCHAITPSENGLNLLEILGIIGNEGRHNLWVEAGGKCFTALMQNQLMHRAFIYIAPKILGQSALSAFNCNNDIFGSAQQIKWNIVGQDVVCEINFI